MRQRRGTWGNGRGGNVAEVRFYFARSSCGGLPRRLFERLERELYVGHHAEPTQRMRVDLGLLDCVLEQPIAVSQKSLAKHYCLVLGHYVSRSSCPPFARGVFNGFPPVRTDGPDTGHPL